MNMCEARRRIWERLATTAVADIDNGDWVYSESDNEADAQRLLKACEQVACAIRNKIARMKVAK